MMTSLPGNVGIVSDVAVTERVGGPLGDQNPDLVHRAAELQVAQVESRRELLSAVPLVGHQILQYTRLLIVCRCDLIRKSPSGILPHLNCDDEDVEGVRFLRRGQRLPLTLQFAHLHPFPTEQGVLTLCVTDGH